VRWWGGGGGGRRRYVLFSKVILHEKQSNLSFHPKQPTHLNQPIHLNTPNTNTTTAKLVYVWAADPAAVPNHV
jgi:hypothetical protein